MSLAVQAAIFLLLVFCQFMTFCWIQLTLKLLFVQLYHAGFRQCLWFIKCWFTETV